MDEAYRRCGLISHLLWLALLCVLIIALSVYMFVDNILGSEHEQDEVLAKAEQYLSETYPNSDFAIEKVYHSFKDNCYYAKVKSESSADTYFKLEYDSRSLKFRFDSYERDVLSGYNTKARLDAQYDALFDENCTANLQMDTSTLTLDAEYNVAELGEKYGVLEIVVRDTEADLQTATRLLQELDRDLQKRKVGYHSISITIQAGEESFELYDVTKEQLRSENALEQLDAPWQAQERHGEEVRASWAAYE